MVTQEEVKQKTGADTISKKGDVFTIRKAYFYRMGKSTSDLVQRVLNAFPNAEIIDRGDHFASFRGGASVAQGSHWFVKFRLNNNSAKQINELGVMGL